MKEFTIEEKAKAYDEALERAKIAYKDEDRHLKATLERIFPELKESKDERIRNQIINFIEEYGNPIHCEWQKDWIAWLEEQGFEPKWCHHKVDLSDCSEEYRKAYYDGWNNCNQQHSQFKSEWNDVVKCLINGMKFYYEDNEEATWGTEKFSMKIKDILYWLKKQSNPTGINPSEFDLRLNKLLKQFETLPKEELVNCLSFYLNVVQNDGTYKPTEWSEEDEKMLNHIISIIEIADEYLIRPENIPIYTNWLKKLVNQLKQL